MPQLTEKSIVAKTRCSHLFAASGRRCRLLAADSVSGLCALHLAKKKALEKDSDFFVPLMKQANRFQSAQAINHSLNNLYDLLARDRISTRRAATLAYISSLLLRTLPAIDRDKSLGICDHFDESCPHTNKSACKLEPDPAKKPS